MFFFCTTIKCNLSFQVSVKRFLGTYLSPFNELMINIIEIDVNYFINPPPSDCFAHLRVLALNACGIKSWAAVQLLSAHLPVTEELYLARNSLPDLPRLKAEKEYQDATGSAESVLLTGMTMLFFYPKC